MCYLRLKYTNGCTTKISRAAASRSPLQFLLALLFYRRFQAITAFQIDNLLNYGDNNDFLFAIIYFVIHQRLDARFDELQESHDTLKYFNLRYFIDRVILNRGFECLESDARQLNDAIGIDNAKSRLKAWNGLDAESMLNLTLPKFKINWGTLEWPQEEKDKLLEFFKYKHSDTAQRQAAEAPPETSPPLNSVSVPATILGRIRSSMFSRYPFSREFVNFSLSD